MTKINDDNFKNLLLNYFKKIGGGNRIDAQSKEIDVLIKYLNLQMTFQSFSLTPTEEKTFKDEHYMILEGRTEEFESNGHKYSKWIRIHIRLCHARDEDYIMLSTNRDLTLKEVGGTINSDQLSIHEHKIYGEISNSILADRSKYKTDDNRKSNVITLFKGDIVIPDRDNKDELIWLEDKTISEIFDYGFSQHMLHVVCGDTDPLNQTQKK